MSFQLAVKSDGEKCIWIKDTCIFKLCLITFRLQQLCRHTANISPSHGGLTMDSRNNKTHAHLHTYVQYTKSKMNANKYF